jgi:hypothetical protein
LAVADFAPSTTTKILSALDIPETVTVPAPVNAVPPEFNKVKLAPPAAACHVSPVASALSATKSAILREQSQRIVLGT